MKTQSVAALILTLYANLAFGNACEDGIGQGLRPSNQITKEGVEINYRYDLASLEYYLSWEFDGVTVELDEPFALRNCLPARIRWSTTQFIILEQGCGSPCWFAEVIPISNGFERRRIWYPADFDGTESIVWFDEGLKITNLVSGEEHQIAKKPSDCSSAFSGFCFDEVRINDKYVTYKRQSELVRIPLYSE